MATTTERFFQGLADEAARPVLGSARGSIRFDIRDGKRTEHWRVVLSKGSAAVDRSDAPADCVVTSDRTAFDEVASGRINALAASLRGLIAISGDPKPLVRFQRLLPAGERHAAGDSARAVGKRRG